MDNSNEKPNNEQPEVIKGYLGIDNGTQGLSIIFTDESLHVVATGEGSYDMVSGLESGCFEQNTKDWDDAIICAMDQICTKLNNDNKTIKVLGIGISGQMHGEVLFDENNEVIDYVRLWCDHRNGKESDELTTLFNSKIARRATIARFLWTMRNKPNIAGKTKHITTPAGYISYKLTGEYNLGIGDASGIFPMNTKTKNYDNEFITKFDNYIKQDPSLNKIMKQIGINTIRDILPTVRVAGEYAGTLNEAGSNLLGGFLPYDGTIPIAAAEGDQPAALAGSLIGNAGTVSCSFGTSVCANSVGDDNHTFHGISPAVDHFCAADGKPINMVWLINGTTFMNTIVQSYGYAMMDNKNNNNSNTDNNNNDNTQVDAFATIMPKLVEANTDCGGLLALPFMNDEPGVNVTTSGTAMILGLNPNNATPGNIAKSAILSTIFNLRIGCEVLIEQGYPMNEIVFTGGLAKTPQCGQIIADVFHLPVILYTDSSDEGSSWGAAIMAKYRHLCNIKSKLSSSKEEDTTSTTSSAEKAAMELGSWSDFLNSIKTNNDSSSSGGAQQQRYEPNQDHVQIYNTMYNRYKKLLELQPKLAEI